MDIKKRIKLIPYFPRLRSLAKKRNGRIFLVGGFLRDVFLGRPLNYDFDFVLECAAEDFSRQFADIIKGSFVVIDRRKRNFRVVKKYKGRFINYDFSALRAESIEKDLKKRDLIINTLILDIKDKDFKVLDFLGAEKNLDEKVLNLASEKVLEDDPLRILRVFYFKEALGFKMPSATKDAIVKNKTLLKRTAKERVKEEFKKILGLSACHKVFSLMDSLGVLEEIFPEIREMKGINQGSYHHLDVWQHSLESLKVLEKEVLPGFSHDEFVQDYLCLSNSKELSKQKILKLSTLFHDIGKPKAKANTGKRTIFYRHDKIGSEIVKVMLRRLKFSAKDITAVSNLVFWHMLPVFLVDNKHLSRRQVFRFFRKTSPDTIAVILLSLADLGATRGKALLPARRRRHKKVMRDVLEEYRAYLNNKPVRRIINGRDVMRVLKIPPSPKVGRVLGYIFEQQDLGAIKTKQQALQEVKRVFGPPFKKR